MLFRVSVYPVGQNEAIDVLTASGLPCTPSFQGSIVEGEWDEVVSTLGEVYRAIREKHGRVYMKVDALDEAAESGGIARASLGQSASWLTGDEKVSLQPGLR